jgi:uncharacterized ubiquitin-like protein YukD
MKAQIRTITTQLAQEMLKRNPSNRPVRKKNIDAIIAAMEGGTFQLNGETIKIAPDGRILDGQHRLMACAISGVSFQSWVIYDVPAETVGTMDKGASRNAADFHAFHGESNSKHLAGAINVICAFDRVHHVTVPYEEQVLFLDKNPLFRSVVSERHLRSVKGISAGVEHACRYTIGVHFGMEQARDWIINFALANYDEPKRKLALYLSKRRSRGRNLDTTIVCAHVCQAAKMTFTGKPKVLGWTPHQDVFPLSMEEIYL